LGLGSGCLAARVCVCLAWMGIQVTVVRCEEINISGSFFRNKVRQYSFILRETIKRRSSPLAVFRTCIFPCLPTPAHAPRRPLQTQPNPCLDNNSSATTTSFTRGISSTLRSPVLSTTELLPVSFTRLSGVWCVDLPLICPLRWERFLRSFLSSFHVHLLP
jgi:hypothetical protein